MQDFLTWWLLWHHRKRS